MPIPPQALRALKAIDPHLRTVMLTGDNPTVAQTVASRVGAVDEVQAGLLPEDKLDAVRNLQERYGAVAMVGDGVNDAPALAAASVGIAMGGAGTAQAMETADMVLMQDNLTRLPEAVRLSRKALGIIRQNITFSLAIKGAVPAAHHPRLGHAVDGGVRRYGGVAARNGEWNAGKALVQYLVQNAWEGIYRK